MGDFPSVGIFVCLEHYNSADSTIFFFNLFIFAFILPRPFREEEQKNPSVDISFVLHLPFFSVVTKLLPHFM